MISMLLRSLPLDWLVIVLASTACILWYIFGKIQRPYLYFSGAQMSRILEKCEWTTDSYAPSLSSILQTWFKMKLVDRKGIHQSSMQHEREILNSPNGAILAIDWLDHPEDIAKKYHGLLVLVNHGCSQTLSSKMFDYIMKSSHTLDVGCCVVNLQGINGVQAATSSLGTGLSMIVELKAVTERIHQHLGSNFPKSFVAVSIGAIPIIEYLAQDKLNYSSACFISAPLNLSKWCGSDTCATTECRDAAVGCVKDNSEMLTKWNIQAVTKASNSVSLSDYFTAMHVQNSSPNVSSLFNSLEPYSRLDQITKPLLMSYALDDESIAFSEDVDLLRLCRNPNIAVAVTEHGGHAEFCTINKQSWIGQSVLEFISVSLRPEF